MASSIATLQVQVNLAGLMAEIKEVAASVDSLRLETQGDRIGKANAIWHRLHQAVRIKDGRLREAQILAISASATEQRCIMEENFKREMSIAYSSKLNTNKGQAAHEAINDLTVITLMVRAEYSAYMLMEQEDTARLAIKQFSDFILENSLNDRETLLQLNSQSKQNLESVLEGFFHLSPRVALELESGDDASLKILEKGNKSEAETL